MDPEELIRSADRGHRIAEGHTAARHVDADVPPRNARLSHDVFDLLGNLEGSRLGVAGLFVEVVELVEGNLIDPIFVLAKRAQINDTPIPAAHERGVDADNTFGAAPPDRLLIGLEADDLGLGINGFADRLRWPEPPIVAPEDRIVLTESFTSLVDLLPLLDRPLVLAGQVVRILEGIEVQTDPTQLGLPLLIVDRNAPPPVDRLDESPEGVVVGDRVRRRANVEKRVVRKVRHRRVEEGMTQLTQLVGRDDDPRSLHASHLTRHLGCLLGLGRNQVNPRLFHPLPVPDRVNGRSRSIRELPWGHGLDARPIPLDGTPDPLLGVPNARGGDQRKRMERRGHPIQESPDGHEFRLAGRTAACETDELIVTALIQHVIGPRVPNKVLSFLIEENLSRVFEMLFDRQHLRRPPITVHEAVKLDRPIGRSGHKIDPVFKSVSDQRSRGIGGKNRGHFGNFSATELYKRTQSFLILRSHLITNTL